MTGTDLLGLVLEAHGGHAAWRAAREITASARSGGFALASRFKPRAFGSYRVTASVTEPRVAIAPYPGPGRRGVFSGDRVRIESDQGAVLAERREPRAAFGAFRRRILWDDLDALYFAGYALWNYLTTPLLLLHAGVRTMEIEPWEEGRQRWRRLRVLFPPEVPTHSAEQTFYFDEAGLLRRLDYTAEVFGSWARAAHYCREHRSFDGLVLPTRRRVLPRKRNGRPRPFPTLVWIEIGEARVAC
jgi:hypothetical protein